MTKNKKKEPSRIPFVRPNQLFAARAILGWSRTKCAKLIGISPDTIKSIEYGKSTPELSTVNKIILGFSQSGVSFVERGKAYGIWFAPTETKTENAPANS